MNGVLVAVNGVRSVTPQATRSFKPVEDGAAAPPPQDTE